MMGGDITHLKVISRHDFSFGKANLNLLEISHILQFTKLNLRLVIATSYSAHLFTVKGPFVIFKETIGFEATLSENPWKCSP